MLNSDHPWTHVYAPGATWSAPLHAMPVPQLLTNTAARWPDQAALSTRLQGAGWSSVGWRDLTGGIVALHRGTNPA